MSTQDAWEMVRRVCGQRQPALADVLDGTMAAYVEGRDPPVLTVYAPTVAQVLTLKEPSAKEAMEWAIEQVMDAPYRVRVVPVPVGVVDVECLPGLVLPWHRGAGSQPLPGASGDNLPVITVSLPVARAPGYRWSARYELWGPGEQRPAAPVATVDVGEDWPGPSSRSNRLQVTGKSAGGTPNGHGAA